ncbi:Transcription repressor NadR [Lacicoccus alkaliphilus]|uniref:Transcription repressor NadR n=1 Tax=Lacicoccus alkaliphilus DSM 16010 TaxID=1123231 RepID=A0A1M7JRF5_9BACL|nr:transcription repressor NadR [Salinicoccus alkaliphilus]SHM55670.1 hypothetical protein SAMN02745189_02360 [Salinicoccus alkaliphilus DSM 16010]
MSKAEQRRGSILEDLMQADAAISGASLAKKYDVSRQIIVSDISILKSRKHEVVSTSKGYVYQPAGEKGRPVKRVVACRHTFSQMEEELSLILDNGAMIDDVSIDHPVYGELVGELMIEDAGDMHAFLKLMDSNKSKMLAELTDNIHLHTISAHTEKILDNAVEDLRRHGFLLE